MCKMIASEGICVSVCISVSCDRVEVKNPAGLRVLCSHTSSNYFIKSECLRVSMCARVCLCVCARAFTQPPGCNDGSRRLLFHSRQVRTYSSQRPAKPGDTLTVIASLHHGCTVSHIYSGYSLQTKKRKLKASMDGDLIITTLLFLIRMSTTTATTKTDKMGSPPGAVIN